jgi:hypothetical protein
MHEIITALFNIACELILFLLWIEIRCNTLTLLPPNRLIGQEYVSLWMPGLLGQGYYTAVSFQYFNIFFLFFWMN